MGHQEKLRKTSSPRFNDLDIPPSTSPERNWPYEVTFSGYETRFRPNNFEDWVSHSKSHFGYETLRNGDHDPPNSIENSSEGGTTSQPLLSKSKMGHQSRTIDQKRPDILGLIKTTISKETGIRVEEISSTDEFANFGIDTMMDIYILSSLRKQTGVNLPGSFFIDYPTIDVAASELESLLDGQPSDKFSDAKANETKPRLGRHEVENLEHKFKKNPKPTTKTKQHFAEDMGVELAQINVCLRASAITDNQSH